MARAAVSGRLTWLVATVKETRDETATARTVTFDVPGWPGHTAGQHVTVKLTAEDGYSTQRDYSIASAPETGAVEITVQRLEDGEVSPYLTGTAEPGDQLELRGPIGGWFAWDPADPRPLLLLAGGSGVVPLMSIIRTHGKVNSQVPVRLIYSARTPADVIYAAEISERARVSPLTATFLYTRASRAALAGAATTTPGPGGAAEHGAAEHGAAEHGAAEHGAASGPRVYAGRLNRGILAETAFLPESNPATFICGPTGFVEAASDLLVQAGYAPGTIKTERFGATG
ncbi:MAG TPA: ferredoxin reductase [Trebonia sp.]|nr:ferredoxin reductase [Trebonia sp.]